MTNKKMINGTSLFANVGIDELYLKDVGIDIKVSNELLPERCEIYKKVYPKVNMIQGDFTNQIVFNNVVRAYQENDCQFLIATPPCQGMSVAGKMDQDDPRNRLIIQVVNFIKTVRPKNVLIENVPGILKFKINVNGEYILIKDYIEKELSYFYQSIKSKVCDAADFGTAQHRKRAIFLLSSIDNWDFPEKNKKKITVEDAIGKLPSLEPTPLISDFDYKKKPYLKWHRLKVPNDRHREWMRHTPPGKTAFDNENQRHVPRKHNDDVIIKGYKTTYKRMSWNKPAPTITMGNGSISSQNNVHPGRPIPGRKNEWSDARVLSIIELMFLTGIKYDDWKMLHDVPENLLRKVIGECFPPKFCRAMITTMPKGE